MIALDLSGFGESAPYPRGQRYDMDNACRDLAANFAEWGIERPHVVGNSLGGAISLELAARDLVVQRDGPQPGRLLRPRRPRLGPLGAARPLGRRPRPRPGAAQR